MAQFQQSNQSQRQGQAMSGGQSQGNPGLSDVAYDVVTLLSNCAETVEVLSEYVEDAQSANDQDVARIFEQIRQDHVRYCETLRQALTKMVQQGKF